MYVSICKRIEILRDAERERERERERESERGREGDREGERINSFILLLKNNK
jgi:hypothetical protein